MSIISASEHYEKGKRQNLLTKDHIEKILTTYTNRPKEEDRYARRVGMDEIKENDYNLNITRYVSTAEPEPIIDLKATHAAITQADQDIKAATKEHNKFLKELGLPLLPN